MKVIFLYGGPLDKKVRQVADYWPEYREAVLHAEHGVREVRYQKLRDINVYEYIGYDAPRLEIPKGLVIPGLNEYLQYGRRVPS